MANSQFITSALIPASAPSPLMRPVDYQGQTYFTSQYFHRQYLENSPHGGKYRQHSNFLKVVRTIPAYADYLINADIVELSWGTFKSSNDVGNEIWIPLKTLFHSTGWNPLTLLNATLQVALNNFLDDEVSRQMAVAGNTAVARQMTTQASRNILPGEYATRELSAYLDAGRLLGTPLHLAQQEAVKMVEAATGVNFRALLAVAPGQEHIKADDIMLEPTALAKKVGVSSAIVMNRLLVTLGFQVHAIGGGWEPTPAGLPHATRVAYLAQHNTHSGYHWKWRVTAVAAAIQAHKQAGGLPI